MQELAALPNVGKVLAKLLQEVGITTPEELRALGAKATFLRIRTIDPTACIQMLYGIQGAVEGIRDRELASSTKQDLKAFFNSL